jgi:hypothetical protein
VTETAERLQRIIATIGTRTTAATAVLLLGLAGCAPGTPDEDSWRDDATLAVGDVLSAVQTARLGIEQAQDDRVPDAYLQTVLVDAERNGGMAASSLSSVQPPAAERRRSSEVTDRLDRATGLLTDARIAVVARDTDEYGHLVAELRNTAHDLTALELDLEHPPGGAG